MFIQGDDLNVESFFNSLLKAKMNLIGFLNRNQLQTFGVHFVGVAPEFLSALYWRNFPCEANTNQRSYLTNERLVMNSHKRFRQGIRRFRGTR